MPTREGARHLKTILFTDIVGSTRIATSLGDARWRAVLAAHHRAIRTALKRHHGTEIDTAGDGFFAAFDSPASAIKCSREVLGSVREIGVDLRIGLHTGECDVVGDKLRGIAVHIGARVASNAGAGEILVSQTVKDLVAGSGIEFQDRGSHELKGVPGEWGLYSVI